MKQRHVALDGLRGVAALVVAAFHATGTIAAAGILDRAGLVVDFFFLMSGFVVAGAYEHRMRNDARGVIWARIVRLYPMLLLGALVGGACAAIMGGVDAVVLAILAHALLLPLGAPNLFPLNPALWSLMLEVGANAGHVLTFRWASTRLVAAAAALGALLFVYSAYKFGSVVGGWSVGNWWQGPARVAFSYPLGVLFWRLHRDGRLPRPSVGFGTVTLLFIGTVLGAHFIPARAASDAAVVLLVWPVVLLLGIYARPGRGDAVAGWLGAISYPLYATHQPIVGLWERLTTPSMVTALLMLGVLVAWATVVDRWIDRPLRTRLGRLFPPKPTAAEEPAPTSPRSGGGPSRGSVPG